MGSRTDRLVVGLVGAVFPNFAAEELGVYPRSVAELAKLSERWGFDLVAVTPGLQSAEDAEAAVRQLRESGADFVLLQNSSFSMGDLILPFLDSGIRLGLWALPEPSLEGEIPLNSLTGFNMLASIARLDPRLRTPLKWFFGTAEDERFQIRLRLTVLALTALKRLSHSAVGLIGDLAPTFYNLAYDAEALEAKLGIQVRVVPLSDVLQRARCYSASDVATIAERMASKAIEVQVEDRWMELTARVVYALRDTSEERSLDSLALRCWPEFQSDFHGLGPCAAVAWLNETGLPTSCEGDVPGAVSMLALHHLSEAPTTLMDLVAVNDDDATIQLWHCGPTAPSMSGPEGARLIHHPTLDRDKPADTPRSGAAVDLRLARGPATVLRFSGSASDAFLLSGEVTDGPSAGYTGSRAWVTSMRIDDQPVSVGDLLETIVYHGLPHHYPIALGDWTAAARELCMWAGIRALPRISYRDHLVTPTRASLV